MARRLIIAAVFGAVTFMAGPVVAQLPSEATPQTLPSPEKDLKPGANSFAESQARQLLEDKGYANVSALVNDKNGIWHGKAIKNQKPVDVSVDFQGRVGEK